MYKIVNLTCILPSKLVLICLFLSNIHPYLTRIRLDYDLQLPRVKSIRMNYRYPFTKTWDELPPEIKDRPNLRSFKKALTRNFIDTYYTYLLNIVRKRENVSFG